MLADPRENPFYKMDAPGNANRALYDYEKRMSADDLRPGDRARYMDGVLHINGKPIDEIRKG